MLRSAAWLSLRVAITWRRCIRSSSPSADSQKSPVFPNPALLTRERELGLPGDLLGNGRHSGLVREVRGKHPDPGPGLRGKLQRQRLERLAPSRDQEKIVIRGEPPGKYLAYSGGGAGDDGEFSRMGLTRRWAACRSGQRRVERDRGLQHPRHRAVGFRPCGDLGELLRGDAGHPGRRRQVDGADGPACLRVVFKGQGRGRAERVGDEAGALKGRERAIVKQPAWAAAISSSGLVPEPSAKRAANEYGVSFRTALSVDRVPFPDLRLPCQTAEALLFIGQQGCRGDRSSQGRPAGTGRPSPRLHPERRDGRLGGVSEERQFPSPMKTYPSRLGAAARIRLLALLLPAPFAVSAAQEPEFTTIAASASEGYVRGKNADGSFQARPTPLARAASGPRPCGTTRSTRWTLGRSPGRWRFLWQGRATFPRAILPTRSSSSWSTGARRAALRDTPDSDSYQRLQANQPPPDIILPTPEDPYPIAARGGIQGTPNRYDPGLLLMVTLQNKLRDTADFQNAGILATTPFFPRSECSRCTRRCRVTVTT